MPMAIGSSSGWFTLAGMIIRPRATSLRTSSGVELLPRRDVRHLLGDDALAGVVHLRDVRLAPALLDPIGPHGTSDRLAAETSGQSREGQRAGP